MRNLQSRIADADYAYRIKESGQKADDRHRYNRGLTFLRRYNSTVEQIARHEEAIAGLDAQMAPLEAEYERRGGWPRAFLVNNTDGHVHRSMNCPTCNKGATPTRFSWLTRYSGASEDEIVADAGWRACSDSHCYPTAPVGDRQTLPTKMFSDEEIAADAERKRREQVAAVKAAKKAAGAITAPDGSPLLDDSNRPIASERTAQTDAVQTMLYAHYWGHDNPESRAKHTSYVNRLVAALAAKRGQTEADVHAELTAKAKAKAKKENWGDWDNPGA